MGEQAELIELNAITPSVAETTAKDTTVTITAAPEIGGTPGEDLPIHSDAEETEPSVSIQKYDNLPLDVPLRFSRKVSESIQSIGGAAAWDMYESDSEYIDDRPQKRPRAPSISVGGAAAIDDDHMTPFRLAPIADDRAVDVSVHHPDITKSNIDSVFEKLEQIIELETPDFVDLEHNASDPEPEPPAAAADTQSDDDFSEERAPKSDPEPKESAKPEQNEKNKVPNLVVYSPPSVKLMSIGSQPIVSINPKGTEREDGGMELEDTDFEAEEEQEELISPADQKDGKVGGCIRLHERKFEEEVASARWVYDSPEGTKKYPKEFEQMLESLFFSTSGYKVQPFIDYSERRESRRLHSTA